MGEYMRNLGAVALDFDDNHSVLSSRTKEISLGIDILNIIFKSRRLTHALPICKDSCTACQAPHLSRIVSAIKNAMPIQFVLPAFPGKSPNLSKVLGPSPDMAERLALQSLDRLCQSIQEIYAPGAHIILCSDGQVFSDIVGMREADVTRYKLEIDQMIHDLDLKSLSTFNLDELCYDQNYTQMRQELMNQFGASRESLREKILRGSKSSSVSDDEEAHRMYCGITRFLVEDSIFPGQEKSRSAIQRECREKAYEMIRRSNAWSRLIAQRFPHAVRLSIHPQTCGSQKLGIRLIGTEVWITPWHGVAVKRDEDFILLKRSEAEALGAQLIFSTQGLPSHFELLKNPSLNFRKKSRDIECEMKNEI